MFLDKYSINQYKKFQVNIFILYIFSLPLKTHETLAFQGTIFRKPFGTEGVKRAGAFLSSAGMRRVSFWEIS
jgi:hypothetical protein